MNVRTILHATDFSAHSDPAFRLACALARDYGARLVLLHVIVPPPMAAGGMIVPPPPPEAYLGPAEDQLGRIQPPGGDIAVERRLAEGEPAEEICRVARETGCDLVVLGTHGRTGLSRLLMGSVAEKVLREAPCPVLTVKIPPAEGSPSDAQVHV